MTGGSSEARYLLLETSGRVGVVAVARGMTLLRQRWLDEARRHARDLTPAVRDLLAEQGWRPQDLHAVLVSRGPGSYTGLRVGIMSAKVLAYATGCRLIGVETFAVLAAQVPETVEVLDVLADAQQDKVYVQRFRRHRQTGAMLPTSELTIEEVGHWLNERGDEAWVTGPGLRAKGLLGLPRTVAATAWDPQAESLLRVGLARQEMDDPWTLEPLYLRPSSAEEKWQAKK